MKKEIFDTIKNELKYTGLLILLALIIFKIAFYKENLIIVIRTVLSLFWLFVIPGYFIMLYWKENLGFIERIIIGIALSASVVGIFSYYHGIIGLNIKFHAIIFPILLILIGLTINLRKFPQ